MSNQSAIFFALGAMFAWSVGDFFIFRFCKKINYFQSLLYVNLIGSLFLLPFSIQYFYQLSLENLWPLASLAVVDLFFGLCLLKAYEQGKLSVVEIIMTLELPLTVLLGFLFFSETLSGAQAFLVLIIFSGVLFISKETKSFWQKIVDFFLRRKSKLEKGVLMALAAAFLSAFYNFFIAYNSREVSPFLTILLPWSISLLFYWYIFIYAMA